MTTTSPINKYADLLDSRDIEARITELDSAVRTLTADESSELAALMQLRADVRDCVRDGSWDDGVTLINDRYFITHAQDVAEDCDCYGPRETRWPLTCIAWEIAARELQYDYSNADYLGQLFWFLAD